MNRSIRSTSLPPSLDLTRSSTLPASATTGEVTSNPPDPNKAPDFAQVDPCICSVSACENVDLSLTSPASATGEDEADFGFPPRKKKSLLSSVGNPPLRVQDLKHLLTFYWENANEVEVGGQGFGPIHYLVTQKFFNKQELLICLAVYGLAEIDLTTTRMSEVTALHLACKIGDERSVKTLIALGANVNKCDKLGNTPLDYAHRYLKHPIKEKEVPMTGLGGGPTVVLKAKDSPFLETMEITASQAASVPGYKEPTKTSKVLEMLEEVGAVSGKEQKGDKHRASPATTEEKINCVFFKEMEDKVKGMVQSLPQTPSPRDAVQVAQTLKQQEEYRKVCGSRILCLDGGGIRGLVQMCILQEIEHRTGKSVTELFDWIVGTSTGGVIALALTYGASGRSRKSIAEVRSKYWEKKDDIFGNSDDGLFGKGNTNELEGVLKYWLGEETRLDQVHSPCVLIPAVKKSDTDLKLHFFNNCFEDEFSKELVWKVARYTSAAPFYFTEFENYIDGGLLANNPSMDGMTKIQDHFREKKEKLPISLLLSVGSGKNPPSSLGPIKVHRNILNPTSWKHFFGLMESAILNNSAHENCRSRCEEQGVSYFRLNPELDEKVDSDQKDEQALVRMLYKTRVYLEKEREQMDHLIALLNNSDLTSV